MDSQPIQREGGERLKISAMDGPEYPKHIERMLDVMLCLPKSAWGLVLASVESKIGSAALQRIILQVYEIEKQARKEKEAPERNERA